MLTLCLVALITYAVIITFFFCVAWVEWGRDAKELDALKARKGTSALSR